MNLMKDKKIQIFWTEKEVEGRVILRFRHFIHKKGKGLWAYMRDLSQKEIVSNVSVSIFNNIIFKVNHNQKLLDVFAEERQLIILHNGLSYNMTTKPDQFEYRKGDMTITAELFIDKNVYTGDIYE